MRKAIDLADYRNPPTVRVFSGRPRGTAVRNDAKLSQLEAQGYDFEIHVPENVIGITASFFLGMFGDSIRALGEAEFRRRYTFTGKDISLVIDDSIKDALKSLDAIMTKIA